MSVRILVGDCVESMRGLPDGSVQTCVTSPPYFNQRDYGSPAQIGREATLSAYVDALVRVFRGVRRILRDDGTLWLNIEDKFSDGELLGVPWAVAAGLRRDGWLLCMDNVWHKPNAMPESVKTRPTLVHEYVFLLAKTRGYFYDHSAVKEPLAEGSDVAYRAQLRKGKEYKSKGAYKKNFPASFDLTARNRRSVWSINTVPYKGAHEAPMAPGVAEICIKAGSREGDTVLDPFFGAGTTGLVADRLGRDCIGCELNPEYAELARRRIHSDNPLFTEVA